MQPAGVNPETLAAGTRVAKKAGMAVAWFYGGMLALGLAAIIAITILQGAGVGRDDAQGVVGIIMIAAGAGLWGWRKWL